MKLIRYNDPTQLFHDWDSFFGDPFRAFAPFFGPRPSSAQERSQHTVEWYEDDDHYYARVEMPGVKREHLRVDAEDGMVRFSYELVDRREGEEEKTSRTERFEQVLRTPDGIETSQIGARLADGILELTLPKAAARKPVSVNIQ